MRACNYRTWMTGQFSAWSEITGISGANASRMRKWRINAGMQMRGRARLRFVAQHLNLTIYRDPTRRNCELSEWNYRDCETTTSLLDVY